MVPGIYEVTFAQIYAKMADQWGVWLTLCGSSVVGGQLVGLGKGVPLRDLAVVLSHFYPLLILEFNKNDLF